MDITFLNQFINVVIVGICLCVGYVIKTSLTKINNKYIPLIVLILGTILSVVTNLNNFGLEDILTGMFSGLASTGLYELFKNLIERKQ